MKLLALDTSSLACSVALQVGDEIVERHAEEAREHTRLLSPMLREVISAGGVELQELDAIVLGNGPGSFIGMRIAASMAQGLAHGAGKRIAAVSSLAAVAAEVFAATSAREAVVAQDAHMNEVYLGVFARDAHGLPSALFPERLQGQVLIDELDRDGAAARIAAGAGWQRYPALLAANRDRLQVGTGFQYPRARFLLGPGAVAVREDRLVDPAAVIPAYLRQKVAEPPREDAVT